MELAHVLKAYYTYTAAYLLKIWWMRLLASMKKKRKQEMNIKYEKYLDTVVADENNKSFRGIASLSVYHVPCSKVFSRFVQFMKISSLARVQRIIRAVETQVCVSLDLWALPHESLFRRCICNKTLWRGLINKTLFHPIFWCYSHSVHLQHQSMSWPIRYQFLKIFTCY